MWWTVPEALPAHHVPVTDVGIHDHTGIDCRIVEFFCLFIADHTTGVLDGISFHLGKPDVSKTDIRCLGKMILASHASAFFKEIGVFVGADGLGIGECLLRTILINDRGLTSPVSSAVIQTFRMIQCHMGLL